jgi:hypothetical protein
VWHGWRPRERGNIGRGRAAEAMGSCVAQAEATCPQGAQAEVTRPHVARKRTWEECQHNRHRGNRGREVGRSYQGGKPPHQKQLEEK